MSLFRKPKKIQRRIFCADDDEDGDPEPPPPPLITQKRDKKESSGVKAPKLLSFADEEEDCEEFKVKKSSQSKRLSKKRDKEKKKVPDSDNNKFDKDNDFHEDNNDNNGNHPAVPIEQPKPKKKMTLEGLILSGREALAADGAGDLSDSGGEEEEEEDEDSRGFHQYRAESVRAALAVAPGHIPDAALIHAARKTRQQARELGDFVPLPAEAPPGARLVREGEADDSADEDEGRIIVRGLDLPSDKPKRGTAAVQSDEEMNSEAEEWEEQQIKKAMPALPDMIGEGEVNPFSVAPPPPRLADAPPHLRPLAASAHAPLAAPDLVDALKHRLEELCIARAQTAQRGSAARARLGAAARARAGCAARAPALDAAYRRAQAARGYLTDLVECLDEKMPLLEALEARALALHRRRCEFLVERRRADLRDQAQDVLALAARPGVVRPPDSEEKVRRTAEREGRRRARRLKREAGGTRHHRDGDSSDDELPPDESQHERDERESIVAGSAAVWADALPAWRSARGVCARLARWRARAPAQYADARAPACLPALLAPYVRHQLILWNPLADNDNEDIEKMDWYKCLMMYGVSSERSSDDSSGSEVEAEPVSEEAVRADPDLMLLPTILNKVVLPKITELVEAAWDPMSVRACVRLRHALVRLAGTPRAAAALRRLAAAARARLRLALQGDVFLPALPPQVMEGPGGLFWRRCAGAGVRLLRGALALTAPPALLAADPVVRQLIETLSCAAGAAPGPFAAAAAAALAETLPRAGPLRAAALRRLAALAALALSRLDAGNPLHLKALEQARAVIAEAKAME